MVKCCLCSSKLNHRLLSESRFLSTCLMPFIDFFFFSLHYIQLLVRLELEQKYMYYSLNILSVCSFPDISVMFSPENGFTDTVKGTKRKNKREKIEKQQALWRACFPDAQNHIESFCALVLSPHSISYSQPIRISLPFTLTELPLFSLSSLTFPTWYSMVPNIVFVLTQMVANLIGYVSFCCKLERRYNQIFMKLLVDI